MKSRSNSLKNREHVVARIPRRSHDATASSAARAPEVAELRVDALEAVGAVEAVLPEPRVGEDAPSLRIAPPVRPEVVPTRRHPASIERSIVASIDVLILLPLLLVAPPSMAVVALAVAAGAWTVKGLYRRRIGMSVLDDLPDLATGICLGLVPAVLVGLSAGSLTWEGVLQLGAMMLAASVIARTAAYRAITWARTSGRVVYPTLLIGSGTLATMLARRIEEHPECGLRLVGTVNSGRGAAGVPDLGSPADLRRIVAENGISDVVVGYGALRTFDLVDVLRTCDRLDAEIYIVPRLFEMAPLSHDDDCVWDIPLRRVRRSAHRVLTWRVKRMFDVVASAGALVALLPVIALTALAVRIELGPGIIFRQTRVGLDGRNFGVLKFRSMKHVTPGSTSPWSVKGDDRIGLVGRFIRRYSLDELPQLLNVLRGDMSVVGPRPERPEFVEEFVVSVPRYGHRHRVPVGLTGLAAVNGLRGDTSIADRAQLDNWYIENWSLWLDVKIMARTAVAVFRGTGS